MQASDVASEPALGAVLAADGHDACAQADKAPQGRFVVIANHVSYLDPIVLFATLPWYFRPLAKKEISKAPLFGFIYGQMSLMVDRSSQHSRARSMRPDVADPAP